MSQFLSKQNIEKQQFYIFVRDLATNVSTNLKHMIEDSCQEKKVKQCVKKKQVIKKKDLIIQKQNEIRESKNIKDDLQKVDYLLKNVSSDNLYRFCHSDSLKLSLFSINSTTMLFAKV